MPVFFLVHICIDIIDNILIIYIYIYILRYQVDIFFDVLVLALDLATLNIVLSEIKIGICYFKLLHRLRSVHWCYVCIICVCAHSFEILNCSPLSPAHFNIVISFG